MALPLLCPVSLPVDAPRLLCQTENQPFGEIPVPWVSSMVSTMLFGGQSKKDIFPGLGCI